MPFCGKCGSSVADGVAYCPQCGAPLGASASAPAVAVPAGTTGLQENVAGTLCYLLGFITGIIFLLIDKRPLVRFHAAQSIVVFGALQVASWAVEVMFGSHLIGIFSVYRLIALVEFVLWLVLIIKAFQGERFRVPLAADVAEQLFGKV